jgi:hypothetical protein
MATMAREYAWLFGRSFLQVALVAANVVQIAKGQYVGMFVVGAAISFLWFGNARQAGRSELPGAAVIYALGAGLGTVTGAILSRYL